MHIINHQHHAALTQQEGLLSSILFWLKKKTRLPDPDVKCSTIYMPTCARLLEVKPVMTAPMHRTQFIFEVTFISVNSDSATQSGV